MRVIIVLTDNIQNRNRPNRKQKFKLVIPVPAQTSRRATFQLQCLKEYVYLRPKLSSELINHLKGTNYSNFTSNVSDSQQNLSSQSGRNALNWSLHWKEPVCFPAIIADRWTAQFDIVSIKSTNTSLLRNFLQIIFEAQINFLKRSFLREQQFWKS